MKRLKGKFNIFRFLCLIAYVICAIVLIAESCMNGETSASQSNTVGGGLANIVNDLGGDQTQVIKPTKLTIENKKTIANVGESYSLNVKILPEDATYQSVIFSSSNEEIATISDEGVVRFLKQGETTIQVINAKYTTIKDSFIVKVMNVEATRIECQIPSANVKDNVYTINLAQPDYFITTKISPENTTFKNITYTANKDDYLMVSEKGKITPLKYSNNEITEILVQVGNVSQVLSVIVDMDITSLEKIVLKQDEYQIYPTQTITPEVTFVPMDATFKEYQLSSSDTTIVSITKKSFIGKKAGQAKVTIRSLYDESVKVEINVIVLPQPDLMNFTVSIASHIYVGTTNKINIKNIQPKYASTSSIVYESLDKSIATVDSKGNVKAVAVGSTKINIKDNKHIFQDKQVIVNVVKREITNTDYTTDFDIDYLQGNIPVVSTNQAINLDEYFAVSKFYYEEGHETINKQMQYSLYDKNATNATLSGNVLTILTPGEIQINYIHTASNIMKIITLIALDNFEIQVLDKYEKSYEMKVGETINFSIIDQNNPLQTYLVEVDQSQMVALIKMNDNQYQLTAKTNGTVMMSVVPCYDHIPYYELEKDIIFHLQHRYSSYVDVIVYDQKTKEDIVLQDDHFEMFMNDKIQIKPTIDPLATIHNFTFESQQKDIVKVNAKGELIPYSIGQVTIIVKDTYSNLSKTLSVRIKNKMVLVQDNPIEFKGNDAQFDEATQTYSLVNGYTGSIKFNFTKDSTYKKVTYQSADEKIISVGQDGKLTPNKAGKTTITLICDDGISKPIVVEIKVEVKKQNVIKDLNSFLLKVRKSLGHFGAFLVLGIFSTFTYMLYLKKKKWLFAVPLNFIQGFGLAALTEYIQTFVPGRSGLYSDVVIDFSGFLCSSLFITLILILMHFIRYIKQKKVISRNN